uniref:hypothetical protein n=1 Tax=Clostridium sp. M62/1 TaxID=411486 RepID=UPI003561CA33
KSNIQLKYSNYVAFSHIRGKVVNNSGLSTLLSFEYETVLLSKNMAISIMMSLFLAIFTVLH